MADAPEQPGAPEDPEELARRSAQALWEGDRASQALGMRVVSAGPGSAEVAMTVRPDMVNGWGSCHGGIVASLADSAFAVACNSHGGVVVAAGFDITFLAPVRAGDELLATAHETALRGRTGLYDVAVTRGDGEVVAQFRGRSHATGRRP